MRDLIRIQGLELTTIVGVHAWEQSTPRKILLDLDIAIDARRAALADRLADTVDYHAIAQRLEAFAGAHRFKLIETLAERMVEMLREEFDLPWVRLTLHKPGAVPNASTIAVTLERGNEALWQRH